jgi:hypothetical protein
MNYELDNKEWNKMGRERVVVIINCYDWIMFLVGN